MASAIRHVVGRVMDGGPVSQQLLGLASLWREPIVESRVVGHEHETCLQV